MPDTERGLPVAHSAAAYARQVVALWPPGRLADEATAVLKKLAAAIADELARVGGRAIDLLEEWDPRTATETLGEWETVLDLAAAATTAERQANAAAAMTARGGQSRQYMIDLAAAFGFVATITEGYGWILRSGFSSGAACYGTVWAHYFRVDVDLGASAHPVGRSCDKLAGYGSVRSRRSPLGGRTGCT